MEYNIKVRAGPKSETPGEPFRYVTSRIPRGVKSITEEPYASIVQLALNGAAETVRKTDKNLTATFKVIFEFDNQ